MTDPLDTLTDQVRDLLQLVTDPDDVVLLAKVLTEGLGCPVQLPIDDDGERSVVITLPVTLSVQRRLVVKQYDEEALRSAHPPEPAPLEAEDTGDNPRLLVAPPEGNPDDPENAFHRLGFPDLED
tara:strand:+ start:2274 stop:2648 length:375 start_codon:yes stop_codon:yes gene_type:complete